MDQSSSSPAERRLDRGTAGLDALLRAGAAFGLALDALTRAAQDRIAQDPAAQERAAR